MAQKDRSSQPIGTNDISVGSKGDHVKNVLTKIHQLFVNHSSNSNNKIPKQRYSHSSNQELRLHRTNDANGPVTPQAPSSRDVGKAIDILKSDAFTCIYNASKNIRESSLTNKDSNNNFDFRYDGEIVVLDETPMYQFMKRASLPSSPCLSHRSSLMDTQRSNRSSLNSESNGNQTRYQVTAKLVKFPNL